MRQRAGWFWLVTGILVALFAGFMTFRTLAQATVNQALLQDVPVSQAVVAARDVPANTVLTADDLEVREMPDQFLPAGAVRDINDALDKITTVQMITGEVVQSLRLVTPDVTVATNLAFTIPAGKVVMALPPLDLMSKLGLLKAGDKVDLLVSVNVGDSASSGQLATISSLQNLTITAIVMPQIDIPQGATVSPDGSGKESGSVQALLFALDPQDALVLKYLKDSGGIIDIVLRANNSDEFARTEPVDLPYLVDKYHFQIPATQQSADTAASR
ncbi:MAG: Flp pilus assembly protein CpaB [Anaerolineae bacterium]|uniref:Flp pilus assembly protein CpaB n=1 Tax=Candidatus Amarolinea dominans TaxID=3140696 RepID=UPI001D8D2BD9|nr:Flp pilus assembly protein CpaB [Anaerolineae bacterium]MBK7200812.1 Flp pilus assembly protein CpaB [Anaerolineae bacterium]MBK9093706.1 Flp pilus assembly protein CpaB [Anaerolineae bacterium]MBK9234229.1 Flp pilus assembly protein CpaB [Anaerolineae bacterium]